MADFKMYAKCFKGFEGILANELRSLGARDVKPQRRVVEFVGDKGFMYKANFGLRSALRILKPIHRFQATNETALYQSIFDFPWEDIFGVNQSFAIFSTVNSQHFKHSLYATLKAKDAIVDRFSKQFNKRPNVDRKDPAISINLHIDNQFVNISLDSSGASLHKRNYRAENAGAPLNEVMAAGLIMLSGWDGKGNFLDPMCGSGTLVIEAAMIAANIPPQLHRSGFAFQNWIDFEPELFETVREGRIQRIREPQGEILGYELKPLMTKVAQMNAKKADVFDFVNIQNKDFFKSEKEHFPLHVLMNPPYDERFKIEDENFYQKIAHQLQTNYPSTWAWIFTGDPLAKDALGMKPFKQYSLLNGKIECDFLGYEME